jgi:UDP-N-acetyl-D-mannosaminuronate dehydrogenase
LYLTWWGSQNGIEARFINEADLINQEMPKYVARRALALVDSTQINPRVLILGVAYKSGVADVRETPATELRDYLLAQGAEVAWHDPLVRSWDDTEPVDLEWECDVAILATKQPGMDVGRLVERGVRILDCTNPLKNLVGVTLL